MNIDISKIVSDKLAQLDADGIIKKKIEETVEKTVTDAITSELGSYPFRKSISDQVKQSVGSVAADCGFSAYNGFIANTVKHIVQDMYSADIYLDVLFVWRMICRRSRLKFLIKSCLRK